MTSENAKGGAKERGTKKEPDTKNAALKKESKQALSNQSSVKPEDYPDRGKGSLV